VLKAAGAVCILLGTSGIGFCRAWNIQRQYEQLQYLRKIIILLRGEIEYTVSCMSEVFFRLSGRVCEPYADLFSELAQKLEQNEGENFWHIWREIIIKRLRSYLCCDREVDKLEELGETLGYLDKEMQINYMNLYLEQLEQSIHERREKLADDEKLNRMLGILAGIFLIIFLW
jgi:stage III sporulation protein AB